LTNKQKKSVNSEIKSEQTLISGNNFYIREEADIEKIAKKLYRMAQQNGRSQEVLTS